MAAHEFLQFQNFWRIQTEVTSNLIAFDIPMPKCTAKEACLIWGVRVNWNLSATDIRHRLWLSKEPSERFLGVEINAFEDSDIFYFLSFFRTIDGASGVSEGPNVDQIIYPKPFVYPYERLRAAAQTTSTGSLPNFHISIMYTIESVNAKQLTAITVRRGTVRHAREQGPEP